MTRVVCLGLATLDVVQRAREEPVRGAKSRSERVELVAGGPATNAAVTAAALLPAGSVTLVTAVGTGPAADVVRADVATHGVTLVDLAPAWTDLPVATCVVHADGERTVVSPGAAASTWPLTDEARRVVEGADALLVDGHHPVAARAALEVARAAGATTVLDAGSLKEHVEGWLSLVDVAAASAAYAADLARQGRGPALDHLVGAGARRAVVTQGPHPVLWRDGDETGSVQPPVVRAVDSLGAGDVWHGALTCALALGHPLVPAVAIACAAAATRVRHADSRSWLADLPACPAPPT